MQQIQLSGFLIYNLIFYNMKGDITMGQSNEVNFEEMANQPVYQKEKVFCKDKTSLETCVCWQPGIVMVMHISDADVKLEPDNWIVVRTDNKYQADEGTKEIYTNVVFHERFTLADAVFEEATAARKEEEVVNGNR